MKHISIVTAFIFILVIGVSCGPPTQTATTIPHDQPTAPTPSLSSDKPTVTVAPLTTLSPPAPVLTRTGPIVTPTFVSTPTPPSATDAKQKIAAICGSDVYAINVDGSGLTNLTSHIAQHGPPWGLPVWSPDGSRVAMTLVSGSESEIYIVKADGSEAINVTNNPATDLGPTWSPDGSQLAFASTRDGPNFAQIYKVSSDGSGLTKLSDGSSYDVEPVWSPDGKRIAFLSGIGEQARLLFVMKADGSDRTKLAGPQIYHPAWLPDSRRIIFLRPASGSGAEVVLTSIDSPKSVSILTLDSWPETLWPYFVVSPDGKQVGLPGAVAAYLDGSGEIQFNNTNWELYTGSKSDAAGWSPDLSKIAFFSRRDQQIYSFDVKQSKRTRLTNNSMGECTALVWGPYGPRTSNLPAPSTEESTAVAVSEITLTPPAPISTPLPTQTLVPSSPQDLIAFIGSDGNLWLIHSDGSGPKQVTFDGKPSQYFGPPIIGYSNIHWSPNGQMLAFERREISNTGQEDSISIWVYNLVNTSLKQMVAEPQLYGLDWTPDSSKIVYGPFVSNPADGSRPQGLWQVDIQTAKASEFLAPKGGAPLIWPQFSPDGRYLSVREAGYMEGRGVFATYRLGDNLYVTWGTDKDSLIGGITWTPDSSSIVYDRAWYLPLPGGTLWKANPDGSHRVPLTSGVAATLSDASPMYSPQGDRIAFMRVTADIPRTSKLWLIDSDGANPRQVVKFDVSYAEWAPDNIRMVIQRSPGSAEVAPIYVVDILTSETRKIVKAGGIFGGSPAWQPRVQLKP